VQNSAHEIRFPHQDGGHVETPGVWQETGAPETALLPKMDARQAVLVAENLSPLLPMKVVIQNPFTLSYLQNPGQWTSDLAAAKTFKDTRSACQFCAQHGLYDLQVALKFPDGKYDVEIPVLSGIRGNRQPDTYERLQATLAP
jgi:hypothetical protein